MPYPKQSEETKKVGMGVSIEARDARLISALAGETGSRSEMLRKVILSGMVVEFGPDWRQKADSLVTSQVA